MWGRMGGNSQFWIRHCCLSSPEAPPLPTPILQNCSAPHLSVTVLNASVLHLAPAIIIYSTFCPPQRATAHREGYAFYLSLTKSWTDSKTWQMLIIIEKKS